MLRLPYRTRTPGASSDNRQPDRSMIMAVQTAAAKTIWRRIGVKPLINACGIYTDLGGSILSPTVWSAMEEINSSFVNMIDLLEETGRMLATLSGSEAARVTPGASAAIALGTAACMTGMDGK